MAPPTTPTWWHSGVIYQIYPRSWADSNGDGIGDFEGIIDRMDYLVDTLPVDALWISPFYPSPQADFGYDVSDYCGVDPIFGDLAGFDRLLDAAHARSLRVIIDWVPNHTSDQHPWFLDARSSRDAAHRDWFIWRDGSRDGGPPNNWRSLFGGPAWTFDATTQQWYLHSFLPQQPDLDWRHPEVEEAMLGTLQFWLERGVDGFRIDVAHRCMKDPLLRNNPPAAEIPEDVYKINFDYATQDHLYDAPHPDIHLLFRKIRSVLDDFETSDMPRFCVGEIHEYDWRIWASYYGWDLTELHMPYNFALLPAGVDPDKIRRAAEGLEAALPTGAWPNWVAGNHDEPRIATRHGHAASKALAVLLLTLRGTPTIYYGDELGMTDALIPAEHQQDTWGRLMPGYGRDGCRTPMQWNGREHAGFTDGAQTWLPVSADSAGSVEAQLGDAGTHLELYRRLLDVRRSEPALQLGDITFLSSFDTPNPLVYRRSSDSSSVTIVLNLSDDVGKCPIEEGTIVAGTHADRWGTPVGVDLRPWEAWVVGR